MCWWSVYRRLENLDEERVTAVSDGCYRTTGQDSLAHGRYVGSLHSIGRLT